MRRMIGVGVVVILGLAGVSNALHPGSDVLVPAAGRVAGWITDLYVMNPGSETATGAVYWLVRDRANTDPVSIVFAIDPGETMVLPDVLGENFGFTQANGAFRVVADHEVVVNSRIYSAAGDSTFGQGFAGVPVEGATRAGETSVIVGLSHVSGEFRTNFYALAGPEGAAMDLVLVDPNGTELATGSLQLEAYEPYLKKINQVMASGDFADGTLKVTVTSGAVVVGASKVDELSTDPTTLESSATLGSPLSVDGTYEISLTDGEGFSSGGSVVIANGSVQSISGTYANWDKDEDHDGDADCPMEFRWGLGYAEHSVADLAGGVVFSDDYAASDSGAMEWSLQFTVSDGLTLSGSLSAVGSNFTDDDSGCNGSFPTLTLKGGKTE